jgi:transcriptional regulator with XRE-family HTH domain
MKRRELAERSELSYPYISEIENGVKDPSAKALRRIADALEISSPTELIALADRLGEASGDVTSVLMDRRPDEGRTPQQDLLYALAMPSGGREAWGRAPSAGWPPDQIEFFDRLQETVATIVRAELGAWVRSELTGLIEREVGRILQQREGTRL